MVVPAYNEYSTLAEIVRRLLALPEVLKWSLSMTARSTRPPTSPTNRRNQGKTEALKTGFALTSGDVAIVQDADLDTTRL
jgi:hypothetical protein